MTGEEITKVATGVVDALKSQPLVLALVIFNVLFMGAVVYVSQKNADRTQHHIEALTAQCLAK